MGGRRDFVAMIEAAYAGADASDEAWLERLADTARDALGFDGPIGAYIVEACEPGNLRFGARLLRGIPLDLFDEVAALGQTNELAMDHLYATTPPVLLQSQLLPKVPALAGYVRDRMSSAGYADVLGIRGLGLDRTGILMAPVFSAPTFLAPRTRMALGRVARHLAAAYRLRRRRAARPARPDAVLTPAGRLEHAEPELGADPELPRLVQAVERIQNARGELRREQPERAVALWRALVAGRWSVVETCESDGKRFLLARKNELNLACPQSLTTNETQVLALAAAGFSNKAAGYELGFSPSTVSGLLRSGMSKLGMRSRAELATFRVEQVER